MKVRTPIRSGFTLVEIMIVVAIIGLLASIAIPNFVHARSSAQQNACISNLRQIDGATQTWALEHNKTSSDTYTFTSIMPYLKLDSSGNMATCPASGTYSPGTCVSNPPTCTLSTVGHKLP